MTWHLPIGCALSCRDLIPAPPSDLTPCIALESRAHPFPSPSHRRWAKAWCSSDNGASQDLPCRRSKASRMVAEGGRRNQAHVRARVLSEAKSQPGSRIWRRQTQVFHGVLPPTSKVLLLPTTCYGGRFARARGGCGHPIELLLGAPPETTFAPQRNFAIINRAPHRVVGPTVGTGGMFHRVRSTGGASHRARGLGGRCPTGHPTGGEIPVG
ncbi:hypothetical protein Taro_010533 [Colocasia esculenta]|uniref:Uncharacterized protein n=1 Tax=Colocasia esculenta TaxID=4460 RepID=A0A843U8I8_COLES|nr:hypothetical protein [Colocasia esculenta]